MMISINTHFLPLFFFFFLQYPFRHQKQAHRLPIDNDQQDQQAFTHCFAIRSLFLAHVYYSHTLGSTRSVKERRQAPPRRLDSSVLPTRQANQTQAQRIRAIPKYPLFGDQVVIIVTAATQGL